MINVHDADVQRTLVQMLPPRFRDGIVLASGSIVEGYGNPTSDLDLMCVTDSEEVEYEDEQARVFRVSADRVIALTQSMGTSIDIEVFTARAVEDLIREAMGGRRHPGTISIGELTLVNNIFAGISIGNEDRASAWRDTLDRDGWLEVLVERGLSGYRGCSEDAQGAITVGNWWSAHYSSTAALDHAVDALSAWNGSTNAKPKWRLNRLHGLGLDDIVEQYWELIGVPASDPEGTLRAARRRLVVAQRWAQLAGRTRSVAS